MKLSLIFSDTDAIRQFSPEDTPRAGRKMQARKASQGSKGIKQRGMKDLMKGLQDCGEIEWTSSSWPGFHLLRTMIPVCQPGRHTQSASGTAGLEWRTDTDVRSRTSAPTAGWKEPCPPGASYNELVIWKDTWCWNEGPFSAFLLTMRSTVCPLPPGSCPCVSLLSWPWLGPRPGHWEPEGLQARLALASTRPLGVQPPAALSRLLPSRVTTSVWVLPSLVSNQPLCPGVHPDLWSPEPVLGASWATGWGQRAKWWEGSPQELIKGSLGEERGIGEIQ